MLLSSLLLSASLAGQCASAPAVAVVRTAPAVVFAARPIRPRRLRRMARRAVVVAPAPVYVVAPVPVYAAPIFAVPSCVSGRCATR